MMSPLKYTFVYPPTVSWSKTLFQRPHQLLTHFARMGHYSVFCNSIPDSLGIFYKPENNLYVVNNIKEFVMSPEFQKLKKDSLIVFLFSYPPSYPWVEYFDPDIIIFDSIDEPTDEFQHWRSSYQKAIDISDYITCSSDRLYELSFDYDKTKPRAIVKNGVDFKHFYVKNKPKNPRPVIGFHGALATWLDITLIRELLVKNPLYTFRFIGPNYGCNFAQAVGNYPNLQILSEVPYQVLPQYTMYFDVGIMPFQVRNMTHSVSACKLYEFMAAGAPVVSTPIRENLNQEPYIEIGATSDEISEKINLQLSRLSKSSYIQDVQAYAQQFSWDKKCQQILDLIS